MAFELEHFGDEQLSSDYLEYLVSQVSSQNYGHYGRLWDYFRNPLLPANGVVSGAMNSNSRPYTQAQEIGLPERITGINRCDGSDQASDLNRKEVVIENDIAWRIHTMIDFLFGTQPSIRSLAEHRPTAQAVEAVISTLFEANGNVGFLQELATFGAVYGFVDVALRIPAQVSDSFPPNWRATDRSAASASSAATEKPGTPITQDPGDPSGPMLRRAISIVRQIILETVEAPRVLPVLGEDDYRKTRYWVQRFHKYPSRLEGARRSWRTFFAPRRDPSPAMVEVIEIIGPNWWQRYEDRQLIAQGPNALGRLPVVHIQNVAVPLSYEGLSDVEPLIPLQDELNTRLSDRATRVTYQSFKMYLGKGIEEFLERPIGPGQMWSTSNTSASIEEFGSDNGSPSEDAHIEQVRAALDKVSAVTPLAAGLIRGNVGYLSSATALKVLLGGLLARTSRKRLSYGSGLTQIVEMVLGYLDTIGVLRTRPEDRRIEIHWPNPLPANEGEQLRNAQIKAQLGLPMERILAELGYDRPTSESAL